MALMAVPPGAAAVVATGSVLTELIVVTLIQLLQTFIHIWGGRGVVTGMALEVVWLRGLLQGCTLPSTARPCLSLFLTAQGCMLALHILPAAQVRRQQGPGAKERKGLRIGLQLSSDIF